MTRLSDIITQLRPLLADEAGTTRGGRMALGISPDRIQQAIEGITVIVQRVPMQGRDSGKVVGGTYFADMFKIELIGQAEGDALSDQSKKMAAAIRKIQTVFNVHDSMYVGPDEDRPEQAHIDVFMPVIESL